MKTTESPSLSSCLCLMAIMLIACLEFLQNGLLNFASSEVMGSVGAAPEEFSYAAMAYAAAAVLTLFQHEWLSRKLGMRRFVQLSLLVFGLGAIICACAATPAALITGRAVQGFGGAAFFTAARIEVQALPARIRMLGLLCFGYALLLGSAVGPLLGAWAIQHAGWRWIFLGILPWLALAWPGTRLLRQESEPDLGHHHTPVSFVALVVAVLAAQWLIQQVPYDFFVRPEWLLLLLCVLMVAALFARKPLLQHYGNAGLSKMRYVIGLFFYFCCYLLVSANSYILPVLAQQVLGFDVPTSGQLLSVSFLASIVFATLYAVLLLKQKAPSIRIVMALACCLLLAYGLLMGSINQNASFRMIVAVLVLHGGFMSLFIIAVAQGTFREVDQSGFAQAYQTKNIIRQMAISMGVAGSTVFLQARNALHYQRLAEHFNVYNNFYDEAMRQLHLLFPAMNDLQRLSVLVADLTRQSMQLSCLDFFRFECCAALFLLCMALWQQHLD